MRHTIERDRIARRLEAAAAHPITLILAPAGCGKSVALAHYLAHVDGAVRYDVRHEHATLLGFVRGFSDALGGLAPSARAAVADAVASARASEAPGAALAIWMTSHLERTPSVVAIDDFHHADGDPACAEFVAALIERTKPHVRWILAARSSKHLPLGSWVAYGDAAIPLDESELRFTAEEAFETARRTRSSLPPEDVGRLHETTAGWATAFTLALRLAELTDDAAGAAATARQLSYEYLAEHVYRSLTHEERDLLAVGAQLPEMDAAVLERAGFERAATILDDLHRRATFLSPAPSGHGFRCHELFRDFLEHELELRGDEALRDARVRAASALLACERTIPALRVFTKARAVPQIVALLEAHGEALVEHAHGDAVTAAIDALPELERGFHYTVVGLRAQLEASAGNWERARSLYERAIATCPDPNRRASLVAQLAAALLNLERDPSALLEPMADDQTLALPVRTELLALLAVAYGRFGRHEGLDELLGFVESLAPSVDSDLLRAQVLHYLGTAAVLHGNSALAGRALAQAAELANGNGLFRLASLAYTSLGSNAAGNNDDMAGALLAAQNAAEAAAKSGTLFLMRYSLARRLDIELHRGDADALDALIRAYDELPGPEHPQLRRVTNWAHAMLAAWRGNFSEACDLQAGVCDGVRFEEERMVSKACYALFLLLDERRDEALTAVADSMFEGKARSSPRSSFARAHELARALCALTEMLAGRMTAATRLLQRRALIVTPVTRAVLGAARAIASALDGGSPLEAAEPHFQAMRECWYGGYARLFTVALQAHAAANASDVALTPTERAILRALADGRSPKEIAIASGSSIHTVRWHIRQAIAKFGCSGREQALRAAYSRGLL